MPVLDLILRAQQAEQTAKQLAAALHAVGAEAQGAQQQLDALAQRGGGAFERLTRGSVATRGAVAELTTLTRQSAGAFERLTSSVNSMSGLPQKPKAVTNELIGMNAAAKAAGESLRSAGEQGSSGMSGLAAAGTGLSVALKGISAVGIGVALAQIVFKTAEAAVEMVRFTATLEAQKTTLAAVAGSANAGASEYAFLTSTADKLSVSLDALIPSYNGYIAATRGTNLEGQKTRDTFEKIVASTRVLGLTNEQVQGTFLAFQQILSKGTVQAEELNQINERLPGALNIAARAFDTTTAALRKMLEQGQITSVEFVEKFANQMEKELGGKSTEAAKTVGAAMARMGNDIRAIKTAIAESGMIQWLVSIAEKSVDAAAALAGVSKAQREAANQVMTQTPGTTPGEATNLVNARQQREQIERRISQVDMTRTVEANRPWYAREVDPQRQIERDQELANLRKQLDELRKLEQQAQEVVRLRGRQSDIPEEPGDARAARLFNQEIAGRISGLNKEMESNLFRAKQGQPGFDLMKEDIKDIAKALEDVNTAMLKQPALMGKLSAENTAAIARLKDEAKAYELDPFATRKDPTILRKHISDFEADLNRTAEAMRGWASETEIQEMRLQRIDALLKKMPASAMQGVAGGRQASASSVTAPPHIAAAIERIAPQHNLDPRLMTALVSAESSFNPNNIGPVTRSGEQARGLMQLMPGTARELGVKDPFNIEQNLQGGMAYFRKLLDIFNNDMRLALAAYNAGPGAVKKFGGIPPYEQTQAYVPKVLATFEAIKAGAGPGAGARGTQAPVAQDAVAAQAIQRLIAERAQLRDALGKDRDKEGERDEAENANKTMRALRDLNKEVLVGNDYYEEREKRLVSGYETQADIAKRMEGIEQRSREADEQGLALKERLEEEILRITEGEEDYFVEHIRKMNLSIDLEKELLTLYQERQQAIPRTASAFEVRDTIQGFREKPENRIGLPDDQATRQWRILEDTAMTALDHIEDSLVRVAQTGKFSFKDFLEGLHNDLARMAIQEAIINPLREAVSLAGQADTLKGAGSLFMRSLENTYGGLFGGKKPEAAQGVASAAAPTVGRSIEEIRTYRQEVVREMAASGGLQQIPSYEIPQQQAGAVPLRADNVVPQADLLGTSATTMQTASSTFASSVQSFATATAAMGSTPQNTGAVPAAITPMPGDNIAQPAAFPEGSRTIPLHPPFATTPLTQQRIDASASRVDAVLPQADLLGASATAMQTASSTFATSVQTFATAATTMASMPQSAGVLPPVPTSMPGDDIVQPTTFTEIAQRVDTTRDATVSVAQDTAAAQQANTAAFTSGVQAFGASALNFASGASTFEEATASFAGSLIDVLARTAVSGGSDGGGWVSAIASLVGSAASASGGAGGGSTAAEFAGGGIMTSRGRLNITGSLPQQESLRMTPFADGGIMTPEGRLPLRRYSGGGVAYQPQVAVFGEGATPEAYVPVPSGKIPVEMRGQPAQQGASVTFNITTPDAGSFRRSERQMIARGQQLLGGGR